MNAVPQGTRASGLASIRQRMSAFDLDSARAVRLANVAVPLAFGLVAVALGLDTNWDLYNYHLYNPYAWLHGKLAIDLAPAGFQSYFNPLLDVPYYWLQKYLPAPLAGFAMGALHGLNFVLAFAIARAVLEVPDGDRNRVALLLALAGCLTANFLASIGNTMGDNATALFVLGSLLLLLRHWDRLRGRTRDTVIVAMTAGVLAGMGAGLKLTNAVYAAALGAALLGVPGEWPQRLRLALVFGIGGVAGIALTAGHWMLAMWHAFGNPLFPQFGNLFPHPLAASVGVADASWGPRNALEALLWPFIFSIDPLRVGQLVLHQVIWPIVYVLGWWWLAARIVGGGSRGATALAPRVRFLLLFGAGGYLLWALLFGISRYLVPLELLAPLIVFVLLRQLFPYSTARRAAVWLIAPATAVVLLGGVRTWGHEAWSDPAFRAELPSIAEPARTTALVLIADTPWAWLATLFPRDVAFVGIGGEILDTPAYAERARQIVAARGGLAYAIVPGHYNWREDNIATANIWVARLGLVTSERGCANLRRIVATLRLRARVADAQPATRDVHCRLAILPADYKDVGLTNSALARSAAAAYARKGFQVDTATCAPFLAQAGQRRIGYQWCRVAPVPIREARSEIHVARNPLNRIGE